MAGCFGEASWESFGRGVGARTMPFCCCGPRQRVAGATLGDKRLLAHDQVDVLGALDRAAGRQASASVASAAARPGRGDRGGARLAAGASWGRGGRRRLGGARNTIRRPGCLDGRFMPERADTPVHGLQKASRSPRAAMIKRHAPRRPGDQRSRTVESPATERLGSAASALQPALTTARPGLWTASRRRPGTTATRRLGPGTARPAPCCTSPAPPDRAALAGRDTAGRCLGCDLSCRTTAGKGARHDQGLARRQQFGQLPVVEATREHHAPCSACELP